MSKIQFVEEHPWEKGFSEVFKKHIENVLLNAETMRVTIALFFVLFIFSMFLLFVEINIPELKGVDYKKHLGKAMLFFFFAFIISIKCYKSYAKKIKRKILPYILGFFQKNIGYTDKNFNYIDPRELNFFYEFDDLTTDDTFVLKDDEYPFSLSEVDLLRHIRTEEAVIKKSTFKGLVLNIYVKGLPFILVKERAALISDTTFHGHSRFLIEDPIFENIYDSYCDDQIEARKAFKPKVIESILRFGILCQNISKNARALQKTMKDDYRLLRRDYAPRFLFNKNGVMLAIPCKKNLFEPVTLFRNAARTNEVKMVLYQLNLVFELIKNLKEQVITK